MKRFWLWFLDLTPIEVGIISAYTLGFLPWPPVAAIGCAFLMCLNFGVNWKHGREWGQGWVGGGSPRRYGR